MATENIRIGSYVQILPAYEMSTKQRTRHDEFTGLMGRVAEVSRDGLDVLVELQRTEAWVRVERLTSLT